MASSHIYLSGSVTSLFILLSQSYIQYCSKISKKSVDFRYNSHIWPPPVAIFLALRVWEGLELVSICNSLNNLEEMTIFGRNDTNTEGMTIIRKE